jgi:hypothetical protein
MPRTRADVATPFASKYLVQLSKHWSHKFAVKWDPTHSHIPFGQAQCWLTAEDGRLIAEIEAPEGDLERMGQVVADHVNRFAFKEGALAFEWAPLGVTSQ